MEVRLVTEENKLGETRYFLEELIDMGLFRKREKWMPMCSQAMGGGSYVVYYDDFDEAEEQRQWYADLDKRIAWERKNGR